mgnify:CR=1 FL=1
MGDMAPRAVFITGAGLSADSGVRTFRGAGGLYEGLRAEDIMSERALKDRPELLHRFCDDRREEMHAAEPNEAHRMIARLSASYPGRVVHLTQLVDGCPSRAGDTDVVHLHGLISRMRSIGNSKVLEDIGGARYWDGDAGKAPPRGFRFRCPKTRSLFRPDVVLFGELAPQYAKLWKAVKSLRRQDVLAVIGTQGAVLPVGWIAGRAPCLSLLNNLHESPDIDETAFGRVFRARAVEAAAEMEDVVMRVMGPRVA